MSPLVVIVVPIVGLFIWMLVVALRSGEFLLKSGSASHSVRRRDDPFAFWALAAFNLGLILYLVYTATQIN